MRKVKTEHHAPAFNIRHVFQDDGKHWSYCDISVEANKPIALYGPFIADVEETLQVESGELIIIPFNTSQDPFVVRPIADPLVLPAGFTYYLTTRTNTQHICDYGEYDDDGDARPPGEGDDDKGEDGPNSC